MPCGQLLKRHQPDERGLMELQTARKIVEATDYFAEGDPRIVDGLCICEFDTLWAALLSLSDGDEFLRHALRLKWQFHVRGRENTGMWKHALICENAVF